VTSAASPGIGRQSVLCLPGGVSETQPFLDGTDLSCSP
jgi:hypothetical protein